MADDISTNFAERLRPSAASEYLFVRHGIRRTEGSLARERVTGTGPRFRRAGRDIVYERAALDEWAQSRLSPQEFGSTAEAAAAAGREAA